MVHLLFAHVHLLDSHFSYGCLLFSMDKFLRTPFVRYSLWENEQCFSISPPPPHPLPSARSSLRLETVVFFFPSHFSSMSQQIRLAFVPNILAQTAILPRRLAVAIVRHLGGGGRCRRMCGVDSEWNTRASTTRKNSTPPSPLKTEEAPRQKSSEMGRHGPSSPSASCFSSAHNK